MHKSSARDLGWLEGIIDGEGSLGLLKHSDGDAHHEHRRGYFLSPRLVIQMADLPSIERAKQILGVETRIAFIDTGNPKWSGTYRLSIVGALHLIPILKRLRLTTKEDQRKLLLEACQLLREHRRLFTPHDNRLQEIRETLLSLHKKGPKAKQ